jgi:hypothetical protein
MVIHPPLCMAHVERAAAKYLVVRPERTAQEPNSIDFDLSVL